MLRFFETSASDTIRSSGLLPYTTHTVTFVKKRKPLMQALRLFLFSSLFSLHPFMEGSGDDFILLLFGELDEVYSVTGYTDSKLWI